MRCEETEKNFLRHRGSRSESAKVKKKFKINQSIDTTLFKMDTSMGCQDGRQLANKAWKQ